MNPDDHRNRDDHRDRDGDIGHHLRLSDRLALRTKEAAAALGVSERTLRQLRPELPTVQRGNIVLFPVAGLQQWLRDESRADGSRADAVVEEILESVGSGRKD